MDRGFTSGSSGVPVEVWHTNVSSFWWLACYLRDAEWCGVHQQGTLAAIRAKIARLVERHRVLVVKPIVRAKTLVKQPAPGAEPVARRQSPKRGALVDVFDELVYFTRVFPHPRLALEIVLVDVEEWRYPGHGRRRWWRAGDHVVADQKLLATGPSVRLSKATDLVKLLPAAPPRQFDTALLAQLCSIDRASAQRIAYCLRQMRAVEQVGKRGNALVYRLRSRKSRRSADEAA